MAILGQQNLNIGAENQVTGSDNLFDAFNKVQNNFTTLFNTSSPFNTFTEGVGISTYANSTSGAVTITNTGVISLTAGSGIAMSAANGNIVISAVANGNLGVTSVGVSSSTLTVSNTPIVSSGNIVVDLPIITPSANFAAGEYIAPTVTVDLYGRITEIANTTGVGTVTSVGLEVSGAGLTVSNSPITSDGVMTITNTGVTRINAGTGIDISGQTGEITISSLNLNQGTVTRIDVSSNNLTITGSPVTTTGEITVDIPDDIDLVGNLTAEYITANITLASSGNLSVTGNANVGNIGATGFYGNHIGAVNGVIGGTTPNVATFTTSTSANIFGANITANGVGSFVSFANAAGNFTKFVTPTNISNSSYYVPNTAGGIHQVMGVTATGATNTLGWKTVPVQYVTVSPRTGGSFSAPYTPILRKLPLLTRAGYINITLS